MNTWNSIAWFPLCVGLSAVGLVLSWVAWRKRGSRSGIRGAAWSLLPLALYLTGSITLVGRMGSAVVRFASSFVFSPRTWSGVALFILAGLLFLGSGGIPLVSARRRRAKRKELKREAEGRAPEQAATAGGGTAGALEPSVAAKGRSRRGKGTATADGDAEGLDADVAEILHRRGIK